MASDTVTGTRDRSAPSGERPRADAGRPGVAGGESATRPATANPIGAFFQLLGSSLVSDVRLFFSRPIELVREKKLMAIPGTLVCVLTIALFALIQHNDTGWTVVKAVAGVHQSEPLWEVLAQLPLSMFAPAPDLPAWGALLQVFIAFGIAECWLGWRRMILVSVVTSGMTSLAARLMAALSLHWSIGTPEVDKYQLDTGPSVAVVALLVYLALRLGTYWIVAATAVTMGGEAALLPNLAGREHLVAIGLGVLAYLLVDLAWPSGQRRWRERRRGAVSAS